MNIITNLVSYKLSNLKRNKTSLQFDLKLGKRLEMTTVELNITGHTT